MSEGVTLSMEKVDIAEAITEAWKWWHDPKVAKSLIDDNFVDNREIFTKAFALIYRGQSPMLRIWAVKYEEKVLGIIWYVNGALSIVTGKEGWKKGLASQAIQRAVEEIFSEGAIRISAFIPKHNKVGKNFFEKNGFKIEGIIRRGALFDGPKDVYLMGILNEPKEETKKEIKEEVVEVAGLEETVGA